MRARARARAFGRPRGAASSTAAANLPPLSLARARAGGLIAKEFGKAVLYYPDQSWFGPATSDGVAAAAAAAAAAQARAREAHQRRRAAEAAVSALGSGMSEAQLDAMLEQCKAENAVLEARLAKIAGAQAVTQAKSLAAAGGGGAAASSSSSSSSASSASASADPAKKKAQLKATLERYAKAWRTRKRCAMDVLEACVENAGTKGGIKGLAAQWGLETDADAGADIKQIE